LDWQYDKWVKPNAKGVARIAKYWKQLDAAAQAKASKVNYSKFKIQPQVVRMPETQAEMDALEAEMNRMDFEGELAAEQRAFEAKIMRDELIANGGKYNRVTGQVEFA
jgi:hypothetical protein